MAVDDDILVKNPFGFQFAGVLVNDAGTRVLPITEDVAQMFQAIIEDRNAPKVEKAIDGYRAGQIPSASRRYRWQDTNHQGVARRYLIERSS